MSTTEMRSELRVMIPRCYFSHKLPGNSFTQHTIQIDPESGRVGCCFLFWRLLVGLGYRSFLRNNLYTRCGHRIGQRKHLFHPYLPKEPKTRNKLSYYKIRKILTLTYHRPRISQIQLVLAVIISAVERVCKAR